MRPQDVTFDERALIGGGDARVRVRWLGTAGFEIERLSWANSLLFPPAVAKRLLERVRGDESELGHASEPDLWQPPDPVNAILESAVAVEALALPRGVQLPFGLSVIALARAT